MSSQYFSHLNRGINQYSNFVIWIIILISISVRLSFSDTNVFFIDGDEAVVGLMALDLLNGDIPVYFYGQKYGFGLIETAFTAIGIKVFGTTSLAIRIPMLCLWSIILFFWSKNLKALTKQNILLFLLIGLVAATIPAWLLGSMKARSGYLTALLFSNIFVYNILHNKKLNGLHFFVQGLLIVLIYESQKLWLPCTLLLGFALYLKNPKSLRNYKSHLIYLLVGLAIPLVGFGIIKFHTYEIWEQPAISASHLIAKLQFLPTLIISNINGNYWQHISYDDSIYGHTIVTIFFIILSVAVTLKSFLKKDQAIFTLSLFIALISSLVGYIAPLSSARYLLPMPLILLMIIPMISGLIQTKYIQYVYYMGLLMWFFSNIFYLPNFKNYSFINKNPNATYHSIEAVDDKAIFNKLINTLGSANIKYVLASNDYLQYYISYFSGGKITGVGNPQSIRIPQNIRPCKMAYYNYPDRFAIIGFNTNMNVEKYFPIFEDKLFLMFTPPKAFLKPFNLYPPDFEIPDQ